MGAVLDFRRTPLERQILREVPETDDTGDDLTIPMEPLFPFGLRAATRARRARRVRLTLPRGWTRHLTLRGVLVSAKEALACAALAAFILVLFQLT